MLDYIGRSSIYLVVWRIVLADKRSVLVLCLIILVDDQYYCCCGESYWQVDAIASFAERRVEHGWFIWNQLMWVDIRHENNIYLMLISYSRIRDVCFVVPFCSVCMHFSKIG